MPTCVPSMPRDNEPVHLGIMIPGAGTAAVFLALFCFCFQEKEQKTAPRRPVFLLLSLSSHPAIIQALTPPCHSPARDGFHQQRLRLIHLGHPRGALAKRRDTPESDQLCAHAFSRYTKEVIDDV